MKNVKKNEDISLCFGCFDMIKRNKNGGWGPRNNVGAQLHDSLGPASNLEKIFCAIIGNYTPPPNFLLDISDTSDVRTSTKYKHF